MPSRPLLLAMPALLAACQPAPPDPAPAPPPIAAPAEAAAPPGPPAAGELRLAGRPFFCAPLQPPPAPPPYCTRSLGQVDCWTRPPLALPARPGLADGRTELTPAQEARRNQCFPGLF